MDRLAGICGRRPAFVEGDCRDAALLDDVFDRHPVAAVMPFVAQVAAGRREFLSVWGDDYPTPDGTRLGLGSLIVCPHA
ncbi:MAG: hypothetical protein Q7T25_05110 [Sideroxyarcus sp.]|nr:hypothetical protein [Sideroxyarcus sp.]